MQRGVVSGTETTFVLIMFHKQFFTNAFWEVPNYYCTFDLMTVQIIVQITLFFRNFKIKMMKMHSMLFLSLICTLRQVYGKCRTTRKYN